MEFLISLQQRLNLTLWRNAGQTSKQMHAHNIDIKINLEDTRACQPYKYQILMGANSMQAHQHCIISMLVLFVHECV